MKSILSGLLFMISSFLLSAQNGTLDNIDDLFTKKTFYVPTPDGASLATDVFLPITSDSLVIEIDIPGVGSGNVELIQKGVQYIYYPTLDSMPNPNPYELPVIMTRTTYGKDQMAVLGYVFSILGYAAVIQDNRGSYNSNDLWMPLYTDGWSKTPYTDYVPDLILPDGYQGNPSEYEDGQYTLDWILNDLVRDYDINDDDIIDFQDKVCNGSIFYFGASALSNSGLLMAMTKKTVPTEPGLKGFLNIIASSEHYNNTLFENGSFKQGLVNGWIRGQVNNYREDVNGTDDTWYNTNHTFSDFGLTTLSETMNAFLDLITVEKADGIASAYPNNPLRAAFDASRAYVDANGDGDATGAYSRYENFDMPVYNVAGWWDIFLNGQIQLWQNTRKALGPASANYKKQKLIIGPWQHYYPAVQKAGDLVFPYNVGDILGVTGNIEDGEDAIVEALLNLNLEDLLKSELFSFIRTSANFNDFKNIGTPQIRFPKNERHQQLLGNFYIQIPSQDYVTTHADLINFLGGEAPLNFLPAKLFFKLNNNFIPLGPLNLTIPPLPDFITDIFGGISESFGEFPLYRDFTTIPDVRLYVAGPVNDSVSGNENVGNYWIASDTFPIVEGINQNTLYLHQSGTLNISAPDEEEATATYLHDPDHPVRTIGGNNLEIKTPDDRQSMGPLDLSFELYDTLTMNREGVISFMTEPFEDTVQIIGTIKAKLYASSLPENAAEGDPTDTDFIIRLLDVYPFGGEYFITEGNVNARAREYVRSIADGEEDDDAPFSNIEAGKVYEYFLNLLPTAYTFGKDHRLKILISSSNYPRYQSNSNIPLEDDEYFRREPGQNKTYTFQGMEYSARKANNSIHFTPEYPSQIILPLKGREISYCGAADTVYVSALSDSSAILNWRGTEGTERYLLQFKKEDDADWTEISLQNTTIEIFNLEPGNHYIWQVASVCRDTNLYSRSDTFFIASTTTSVKNEFAGSFYYYPNPVTDIFTINCKKDVAVQKVVLYGATGEILNNYFDLGSNTGSEIKLDLSEYPMGSYFIEIIGVGSERFTIPIIKVAK
ncbi:MAG: CocE/NonD family hydrolase [Bacteroidetes bacterium]|nr:CocE/NonD family hydrolase [Bacteroidota bacterium]